MRNIEVVTKIGGTDISPFSVTKNSGNLTSTPSSQNLLEIFLHFIFFLIKILVILIVLNIVFSIWLCQYRCKILFAPSYLSYCEIILKKNGKMSACTSLLHVRTKLQKKPNLYIFLSFYIHIFVLWQIGCILEPDREISPTFSQALHFSFF